MIEIYSDGSARGNGKANNTGGWGISIFSNGKLYGLDGEQCNNTTNNREEFKAIIAAINFAKTECPNGKVIIYSDSAYCLNTIKEWMYSWQKRGWKKADKKEPENLDLVQKLYNKLQFENNITFVKVAGHDGILGNEIADAIATDNERKVQQFITTLRNENLLSEDFILDEFIFGFKE